MSTFQERVATMKDKLDRDLAKYPMLVEYEEKFGVNKVYLAVGGAFSLAVLIFFGVGASLLTNLVGFLYPAYASFKAIESEEKDDDTQWLTYWVCYAAFNILESFTDWLLFWVPFYYAFKLGFLVWCFLPSTKGARFVYEHAIAPVLRSQEDRIDAGLSSAGSAAKDIGGDVLSAGKEVAKEGVRAALSSAAGRKAVAAAVSGSIDKTD